MVGKQINITQHSSIDLWVVITYTKYDKLQLKNFINIYKKFSILPDKEKDIK